MPLCCSLTRFAVRSPAATSGLLARKPLQWRIHIHCTQHTYRTTLEQRHEDDRHSQTSGASQYLDFVLAGYGAASRVEKADSAQPVTSDGAPPSDGPGSSVKAKVTRPKTRSLTTIDADSATAKINTRVKNRSTRTRSGVDANAEIEDVDTSASGQRRAKKRRVRTSMALTGLHMAEGAEVKGMKAKVRKGRVLAAKADNLEAKTAKTQFEPSKMRDTMFAERPKRRRQPTGPTLSNEDRARIAARWSALKEGRYAAPAHQSIRGELRNSAVFSSAWNTKFYRLLRRYDRTQEDYYLREAQPLTFGIEVSEWVDELLGQLRPGDKRLAIEAFARRHGKLGREVWSEVALWLLCYQKDSLIDFLLATHTLLYPPINWVEDCLYLLAKHYSMSQDDSKFSWLQVLAQTFFQLVDRDTGEQWIFNRAFIRFLIPHCSDRQVQQLYSLIKTEKVKVTSHTMLHLVEYFAKHNHVEQALDALLEAKSAGARINGVAFRSACSSILRKTMQHPGGLRICLRVIENLVSIGVKLDRRLCNIVMLNAVEAGDIDTADAVHRSAIEQGFNPDAHTCAIRLKACKLHIRDSERLKTVIEEAISNGNVRRNEIVATEIMHCLTLQHLDEDRSWDAAFTNVATAYVQLYDTAPLERLGLDMPKPPPLGPGEQRLTPSRHVITFLLTTFLKHGVKMQKSHQLYTRWRDLVEKGDAPLAACAATPHLSNVFLKRFVRKKQWLLQAAQVVKDMQKPLPESAGVEQAKPDAHTWSIFLHGFASNGQTMLAEQVLRYMRDRGIEPNHVTWTSLVSGYATSQDREGLLGSLRRMEQSGAAFNEWTYRGMRRFKDQQRLKEVLEQQRLQQRLDFSGELKADLAQKLVGPNEAVPES